jgi:hypothetical protein
MSSNGNRTPYNVPQFTGIELLSPIKSAAFTAIYGIGVRAAEKRLQANSGNKQDYDVTGSFDNYSPDAQPDGLGGYKKSDRYDGYMASSLLGMPVMCHVDFKGGNYVDFQGNAVTLPDVTFETVLISVNIRRNNVRTPIRGRATGDVTELSSMGNFDVELRVIVTADAPVNPTINKMNQIGVYPRDNMEAINQILLSPVSIPVECWYLQQFGINFLMIDDGISIEQIEGEYTMQRITIPCYSDSPLIVKQIS